mmetsp:Transcript_17654/g.29578  ORF Transcript_17654/g.29578 Transcript_17654/m.29578 type:complete len:103 (-) Transcript_17654:848-1156(-)
MTIARPQQQHHQQHQRQHQGFRGSASGSFRGPPDSTGTGGIINRGGGTAGTGTALYRPPTAATAIRSEELRKPADSLNLDEFLAESSAADLRKISSKKSGKL